MVMHSKKAVSKRGRNRFGQLDKRTAKLSSGHGAEGVPTRLILQAFRKMSSAARAKLLQRLGADGVVEVAPQKGDAKPGSAWAKQIFEVKQHRDDPTGARTMQRVQFGDVIIVAPKLPTAKLQENLAQSARVLDAAMLAVQRPGVRISRRKGVPLYYADESHPGKIVRELNGQREVGVVEGSTFVVTG